MAPADRGAAPALSGDAYLRLLVENVVDYALYILDPEGRVTTWNVGAQRMKGYAASDVIGRSFELFFPPDDIAAGKPAAELAEARANGRFEDEGFRVRKDGSRFWANAVLTPLHDPEGRLVGFAKITRDLSARREAEEKDRRLLREQTAREVAEEGEKRLRASEERYRELSRRLEIVLEGVADGITVQDAAGKLVFANGAAARLCGFASADELLAASPGEVVARFEIRDVDGAPFPPASLPGRRVIAGLDGDSATLHIRERATGRERWVLLRASPALDAAGNPLAVNIWHDVTNERRHEVQARVLADATAALGISLVREDMLAKLAAVLVPGLGDWCTIYRVDGEALRDVTVAHADPSKIEAARAYREKYPPDPADPAGVWSVIRSARSAVFNGITDEMLAASTPDETARELLLALQIRAAMLVPIVAATRARTRVLGVMVVLATTHERVYEPPDLALAEEVARRAGVALENAELYNHAQAAAKTAEEASRAKDEFLATVSHELRTPLSAILGWSTLLKDRVTDAAVLKPIHVIHRNAQAQVRIIDDILDVSRVIAGKLRLDTKPTDLVAIARDAIEVVRPSADAKKLAVEARYEESAIVLVADPERLQQAVWNLLSNAVKFTPSGGTIELSVRRESSQVVLEVTDTGVGIEPSFIPVMFERFKQADSSTTRRVGGLGLGLALVRHIVELHGGSVSAASEGVGKGARFTLVLPIRAVAPTDTDATAPPPESLPGGARALAGIRVLVVDDEPDARSLVSTVLSQAHAEVETAGSAPEAFASFKRFRPDVLLSDIGMPDEDGYGLIRRVRALPASEGGRIPAIALTAFTRDTDRSRALAAGYTSHVGKPVNPDELVAAVASLARIRPRTG